MTALIHKADTRVPARALYGMWVVDCHFCRGAERVDPSMPTVECSYCGRLIEIIWPSRNMIAGIERILSLRPLPYTRNWFPGETLVDLMEENDEHEVMLHIPIDGLADGLVLSAAEDRILTDRLPLPAPTRRLELKG